MAYKKKLIEVSIPLEDINEAAAKEKTITHGNPSTLHRWWARRPLATVRAVLFASIVDDPSSHPETFISKEMIELERKRLHDLIRQLVKWKNVNNQAVLDLVREEIKKSCDGDIPTVWDPFCGGGAIPLEAQRLGLPSIGSDLNPVAVMITKAMIEIPSVFNDKPAVNPNARRHGNEGYEGLAGLANDVQSYGEWMRNEAEKRIGQLYPKIEYQGRELPVIAWIFARTVKCSNPACGKEMPLARSFILSKKKNRRAYVQLNIKNSKITYQVISEQQTALDGTVFKIPNLAEEGTVGRNGAKCLHCGASVSLKYIRTVGKASCLSKHLIAIVGDGGRTSGRTYLSPNKNHENAAKVELPKDFPKADLPNNTRDFKTPNYGMKTFQDLFTPRQLTAMVAFSDLVGEAIEEVRRDALVAGMPEGKPLNDGGNGALAYGQAVGVYLSFGIDLTADYNNRICTWNSGRDLTRNLFARQAIPMSWDFAVNNPIGKASGSFISMINQICKCIPNFPATTSSSAI
jgi:putative DNA methylase